MDRQRAPGFVPERLRARGRRAFAAGIPAGFALLGTLLLVGAAGCGTGAPPGEGYEILGFVTEAQGTGEGPPIGGALVVFDSDTGRHVEAMTESNGHYRVFLVSDTRFGQLTVSAAGYQDRRTTVFFDSASRRVDVSLARGAEEP